ncbi:Uncharacterised protein [Serratia entomophila]|uniref:hypothetical protein n=1 Tax=Serratia entomophila TaxID=42906 RepID=UPI001F3D7FF1|nr:hypothetical protein [Serratia entomophila]UIW19286.1 hypothetical protein KHA73_04865 [Serratia entomophila]UIW19470.1 hypothetical protein KHA73_05835 [Serratia entomophila]CAI0823388.1 Uncharacterised protein [Serratia entomophila]CAI0828441.1 Uncharacterised protein [Serratia entomophila]CAI0877420.1 Uncharacterised protein [Serratia entomophila]
MEKTDEFFEQAHPHVVSVLGTALMQLLVEERELSREALVEMIQVLYQDDDFDLAAELAIDVLRLPKEGG